MKIHESFAKYHLRPAMENYKQNVVTIYPNAKFSQGFIYDGWRKITETRWNVSGIEAEYYAWMWAFDAIGQEMLRKLES